MMRWDEFLRPAASDSGLALFSIETETIKAYLPAD